MEHERSDREDEPPRSPRALRPHRLRALAALAVLAVLLDAPPVAHASETTPELVAILLGVPGIPIVSLFLFALKLIGSDARFRVLAAIVALPVAVLSSYIAIRLAIDVIRKPMGPYFALAVAVFVYYAAKWCWTLLAPRVAKTDDASPPPPP